MSTEIDECNEQMFPILQSLGDVALDDPYMVCAAVTVIDGCDTEASLVAVGRRIANDCKRFTWSANDVNVLRSVYKEAQRALRIKVSRAEVEAREFTSSVYDL